MARATPRRGGLRFTGWSVVGAWLCWTGLVACYVDEPIEAPEPSAAPPSGSESTLGSEPSERGVSEVVEQVRREDAQAQARAEAEDARWAELEAEAATMTPAERMQDAKLRFKQGVEAFDRGDYGAAQERFGQAYVLAPELHALAFNIARAAERAGDCCTAREHYLLFIEHEPEAPASTEIGARLEALVCVDCP